MEQKRKQQRKKQKRKKQRAEVADSPFTKNQLTFLNALKECYGIVSKAAHMAGLDRKCHYNWMDSAPEYAKEYEAICDDRIDFVEDQLISNISNGDTTAIIFFLKTKAKKRGYVEKQEIDHNFGGQKIKIGFKKPGENGDGRDKD